MAYLVKGFVAMLACICLFTSVDALVYCQIPFSTKGFVALLAVIQLFTRVDRPIRLGVASLLRSF